MHFAVIDHQTTSAICWWLGKVFSPPSCFIGTVQFSSSFRWLVCYRGFWINFSLILCFCWKFSGFLVVRRMCFHIYTDKINYLHFISFFSKEWLATVAMPQLVLCTAITKRGRIKKPLGMAPWRLVLRSMVSKILTAAVLHCSRVGTQLLRKWSVKSLLLKWYNKELGVAGRRDTSTIRKRF